ncbi:MAG TPA: hypothetical protein EYP56_21105 [Planctomycetaceae bacterium]|nr:hypothetical protein [Planctomycetaceae bacterium]HIQ22180.1 hypothetical protein [Planctomycetota bacterium]
MGPGTEIEPIEEVIPRSQLEGILDRLDEALLLVDAMDRVWLINRRACGLLEVSRQRVTGAEWPEFLQGTLQVEPALCRPLGMPGSTLEGTIRTQRSGERKRLLFSVHAVPGSGAKLVVLRPVGEPGRQVPGWAGEDGQAQGNVGRDPAAKPVSGAGTAKTSPEAVREALEASGWNVARASRRLGVSRVTVYKWIHRLGLQRPAR